MAASCGWTRNGRLLWINSRVETITGYTSDECHAMSDFPLSLVAPQEWKKVREAIAGALHGTTGDDFVFRARRKDGSELWASANWRPIYSPDQAYLGLRLSVHDVTARQEAENKLSDTLRELEKANAMQKEYLVLASDERARLNALLNAMQIGILFVDRNNRVIYSNPAFEHIWLLTRSKTRFSGMDASTLLLQTTDRLSRGDEALQDLLHLAKEGEPAPPVEVEMSDGRLITRVGYPVRDSTEQMVGYLWLFEDVTRERQTANQILYLAERDALTGLFNRHRFQEELTRMLSSGERRRRRVALLFFDIDEFKHVNDTFGHRAGDALLIRVAGEVSAQVRRNEIFARLGGDEFAILAPDISDQEAESFAERIVRAIARIPFSFEGNNLRLTCSLGVAVYPDHASAAEDLVAHADAAMYQAKEAGKNTWRMYREDAHTTKQMLARLSWNERIEDALENDLLRLHYQGVYHCSPLRLSHVEALVRMVDREDPDARGHAKQLHPGGGEDRQDPRYRPLGDQRLRRDAGALSRCGGNRAQRLGSLSERAHAAALHHRRAEDRGSRAQPPDRGADRDLRRVRPARRPALHRVHARVRRTGVPGRLRRRLLFLCLSEASGRGHAQDRRAVHPRSADRP